MAHLDLHEQEQLSKLKYFWRDWGKYFIAVLLIALVIYVANVIWVSRQTSNASNAAFIYTEIKTAVQNKDTKSVYKLTNNLQTEYPRVEYTTLASIIAAKIAYEAKDYTQAGTYLNWTIQNSKDKGMAAIAMLRLADVYIDEKKFDLALNILKQEHDSSFDALFYVKRGDLYVASGDLTKARDAYKEAIDKAGQDQGMVSSIQMKLDVLGG